MNSPRIHRAFVLAVLAGVLASNRPVHADGKCPSARQILSLANADALDDEPVLFLGNPTTRVHRATLERKRWVAPEESLPKDFWSERHQTRIFHYESHRVLRGQNEELNRIIDAIEAYGGEVRVLTKKGKQPKKLARELELSYFGYSGRPPVLVYEVEAGPGTIAHEYAHFEYWKKLYDQALLKNPDPAAARATVFRASLQDGEKYWDEVGAVNAEMSTDKVTIFSPRYLERITYPNQAQLHDAIRYGTSLDGQFTATPDWLATNRVYIDSAIEKAIWTRTLQQLHLKEAMKSGVVSASQAAKIRKTLGAGIADAEEILRLLDIAPADPLYPVFRDRVPLVNENLRLHLEQVSKKPPRSYEPLPRTRQK